ncbi:MAG: UDP-N-acetylmuramoyl-L-alanine--D-glutamate ligase [Aestuariivita sp.]|nr:UDP-N-acetylmuramoyl-L-alanine--D-glutamate ligase [Aestuariivita sp.]
MIKAGFYVGEKIAVLGLGRTGLTAAASLTAGGAEVVVWDDNSVVRNTAIERDFTLRDLRKDGAFYDIEALIVSPGIAHLYPEPHPVVANALEANVPLDNDIGIFFSTIKTCQFSQFNVPPRVVAVTGSNGKSTTAALIQHILKSAERSCQFGGNIGRGVLDLDLPLDGEVIVLELASYQIDVARLLLPDVAVFTNFSPDHLDRHGGLGGYFAAKGKLFKRGMACCNVIGVDEVEGEFLASQTCESPDDDAVIRIAASKMLRRPGWSVFIDQGVLVEYRDERPCSSIDLRNIQSLPGNHNHQNACAAFAAARSLHVESDEIEAAFQTFQGLPHRSQRIADVNDVAIVNDSKATNVGSAMKALNAFSNIRWICGGLEKEGGLQDLKGQTKAVKKAYVIGRDADGFAVQLDVETEICRTMDKAVARAFDDAEPGDTILLAPAAASFDQYDNFEQRGEDFVAQVNNHLTRQ